MAIICLDFTKEQSSLISGIQYDEEYHELTVYFHKYYTDKLTYVNVSKPFFNQFVEAPSFGKFYLTYIKTIFNLKRNEMSDEKRKPTGINKAKKEVRYMDGSIDVSKINKDWLFVGKDGVYLKFKFRMLPDGEVDKYGNLGMVTQKVPDDIRKKEKDDEVPKSERASGAILGNIAELVWEGEQNAENQPGTATGTMGASEDDRLPF